MFPCPVPIPSQLTHGDPGGNVPPGAEVGDEDDGADVADLVHGGDDAGDGGGDLVPLLDRRDHRVEVAGRQRLLHGHQHGQQKYKNLERNGMKEVCEEKAK